MKLKVQLIEVDKLRADDPILKSSRVKYLATRLDVASGHPTIGVGATKQEALDSLTQRLRKRWATMKSNLDEYLRDVAASAESVHLDVDFDAGETLVSSKYPQHLRVAMFEDEDAIIGGFLEWAFKEHNLQLIDTQTGQPSSLRHQELAQQYFGVDLEKFEEEKRAKQELLEKAGL